MSTRRFSPASWSDGARAVDATAEGFAAQAQAILGRLGGLSDVGGPAATEADAAVAMILRSVHSAAARTVAGIAEGLAVEADTMAATGRAYEAREAANEALAAQVGA